MCAEASDCMYGYSLGQTPIITATSPTSGNEGAILTVIGHAFSLTAWENYVTVGGAPCAVLSAEQDTSYTATSCPVVSCTQEMRTQVIVKCRLPHNDAFLPHDVLAGVYGRGASPMLEAAKVTYSPQLRAMDTIRGSMAGGTIVNLFGDGLSNRGGDVDVTIGGSRCTVLAANISSISCITGRAATTSASSSGTVVVQVRGVTASCSMSPCTFLYDADITPRIYVISVLSRSLASWRIRISGSRFLLPGTLQTITIGGVTPCTPVVGFDSMIECESPPPLSGKQLVTLSNVNGYAIGSRYIEGEDLSVEGVAPANASLAGGTELTISGSGFSATDSRVAVCGKQCAVTSVSSLELKCTVPSLLIHATGRHTLNLTTTNDTAREAEHDLGYLSPPPPPPNVIDLNPGQLRSDTLTLRGGKVVALRFFGLNDTSLPRGSELDNVYLKVVPHSGGSGAVVAEVRASLYCPGDGPSPLSSSELQNYNQTNATIEWDIQPYDLGFTTDHTPNLAPLLREAIDSRYVSAKTLVGCSLALIFTCKTPESEGFRTFYDSGSLSESLKPELKIIYTPPTSAAQVAWTPDKECAVDVAVPKSAVDAGGCDLPTNGGKGKSVGDTNTCPHLSLEVTAATSGTKAAAGGAQTSGLHGHAAGTNGYAGCVMTLNGVDLLAGCELNKLVVGRDGVCAALIDPPNKPRAACFDTKTQGAGAEQLASWIDSLPVGASAMVVSCSRLSWAHNRDALATSLRSLGAQTPPSRIDDAYALVGVKGAASPLSEARTACCTSSLDIQGNPTSVCHTCDQTVAYAKAEVACGAPITAAPPSVGAGFLGSWGSEQYQSAIKAIEDGSTSPAAQVKAAIASSLAGVIAALQEEDSDAFDAECDTAVTDGVAIRHGARLATDGDRSSFWLSAGRTDAVLTIDLGVAKLVRWLDFDWKYPASSLIIMTSPEAAGTESWAFGASVHQASSTVDRLMMSSPTVARRVRVYMADAANATWPQFGINELSVAACPQPEVSARATNVMWYSRHSTPRVRSVSPKRGSTAGGTALTILVDEMPNGLDMSAFKVSIAGTACAVTFASDGEVRCKTGSYGVTTMLNPGSGLVQLTIAGVGTAAAEASALYEYVDLWSRRTTWGGGASTIPGLETAGDSVWIQQGQRIVLDCNVKLYMVIVQGSLEFDRKDIQMDANYIFVMGGSFIVGTEKEPFMQNAVITLHGSPVSQEIPVYGAKTLSCRFCTLDLHGKPLLDGRTHTKLLQTANAGDEEIWLMEPVSWDADSQIAITSTHYNGTFEAFDTAAVVAVTNGGRRLQLASPLLYEHLGETKIVAGGHSAEFRADVAILSRNVVIQGDPLSRLDKHGAHIMLHSRDKSQLSIADRSQGESLTARIENIEVRYSGQMGRIGRYSIHFHMIGAVRNSYVRKNSIHHTFNRAIAIHGVHYLRVQDNVAFETRGHQYFVEDGLETKNIITGNLGANARENFVGLTSDATPAVYWLVNGDNYFERNIAAGGTHYGVWFFPEPKVRGASEFEPGSDKICPQGIPIYHFADNEGHNMGRYGLRIFTGRSPHNGEGMPGFYPKSSDPCAPVSPNNQFKISRFQRQYSWRNGKNGITVGSVAAVQIVDAVVADNNMRGVEMTGADGVVVGLDTMTKLRGAWGLNKLINVKFIGHPLPCPKCDHSFVPNIPQKHGIPGQKWGQRRLGLVNAAAFGLTVENATFINCARPFDAFARSELRTRHPCLLLRPCVCPSDTNPARSLHRPDACLLRCFRRPPEHARRRRLCQGDATRSERLRLLQRRRPGNALLRHHLAPVQLPCRVALGR